MSKKTNTSASIITIANDLKKLTDMFKDIKGVECIYFYPNKQPFYCDSEDEQQNARFEFVIVVEDNYMSNELYGEISKLDDEIDSFFIHTDINYYYTTRAYSAYEVEKVDALLSSVILYDPTGEYHEIAHQFDDIGQKPWYIEERNNHNLAKR